MAWYEWVLAGGTYLASTLGLAILIGTIIDRMGR